MTATADRAASQSWRPNEMTLVNTGPGTLPLRSFGEARFPAKPPGVMSRPLVQGPGARPEHLCQEPGTQAVMAENACQYLLSVPCTPFRLFGIQPRHHRSSSDPTTRTCFRTCASLLKQPGAQRQVFRSTSVLLHQGHEFRHFRSVRTARQGLSQRKKK